MLKGYDVVLDETRFRLDVKWQNVDLWARYVCEGKEVRESLRAGIRAKIVSGNWVLSGNGIESNWFPKLANHVFISHSHQDENLALALAGALKRWLGLDSFVDSSVWGYYADLKKVIYDRIVALRGPISGAHAIELKNSIASHVHCMLTKSLIQMMDQCECLLFLNTPASIGIRDVQGENQETYSPWIYTEVEVSRFLRTHPDPRRPKTQHFSKSIECLTENQAIKDIISYPLNLDHFKKLDSKGVLEWIREGNKAKCAESDEARKPFISLDTLYNM